MFISSYLPIWPAIPSGLSSDFVCFPVRFSFPVGPAILFGLRSCLCLAIRVSTSACRASRASRASASASVSRPCAPVRCSVSLLPLYFCSFLIAFSLTYLYATAPIAFSSLSSSM